MTTACVKDHKTTQFSFYNENREASRQRQTKCAHWTSKRNWSYTLETMQFKDGRTNEKKTTLATQILECGTWYHHPRRLQCVLSINLRIFKVATWHYRCRHNLKNNCIWDNLQYCLLVPRSSSKPVMLTIDLQSRKVLFIEIVFRHV